MIKAPILKGLDWDLPFKIMCNVSNYVVGVILWKRVDKKPTIIYYASKTLAKDQMHYMTMKKELLATVYVLKKLRTYILRSKIIIYSNHAALKYVLSKKEAKPRLIRWVLLLQHFDLEIKDKKGSKNSIVDHLSHLYISST